jgi:hypothetical protein
VPISAGELVDLAELIDESVAALEAAPSVTPEGQVTEALREELRLLMLEQPTAGRRETYSDGFAMGLSHAIHRLDALAATRTVAPEPHAGVSEEMRFEARQTGDTANAMADWELDAIYLAMQRASVAPVQDDEP